MSIGLKVQFNINECIVSGMDEEIIVIELCKGKLYEMNFTKVHEALTTNFVLSLKRDGILEIQNHHRGYLNLENLFVHFKT